MPQHNPNSPDTDTPLPGELHADRIGAGPRVVLAHGFTQTRRIWGGLDTRLATSRTAVRVDLPGHGDSGTIAAGLGEGAALLGRAGGSADYVGYSMGARFCLHVALDRPDLVRRLVLISGTAGIDDPTERSARRRDDEALAARLDPTDGSSPVDTVETFVTRWLAAPMFGDVPAAAVGIDERLTNTATGLASSLRLAGTGTQEPLWDRLPLLTMPVLVVTGARDEKFTALGSRLAGTIGDPARQVVVPDTDHAPHLQQPERVGEIVSSFLDD